MEIVNRELVCIDCGNNFIFSAGEQLFFKEKNFVNDPKRCKLCKSKRATEHLRALPESQVQCEECGVMTTVPFRPNQGRPVYCRACFQTQPKTPILAKPSVPHHAGGMKTERRVQAFDGSLASRPVNLAFAGSVERSSSVPMHLVAREKMASQSTDVGPDRPSDREHRLLKTS